MCEMYEWVVAFLIGLGIVAAVFFVNWFLEVIANWRLRKIRKKNLKFLIKNKDLLSSMGFPCIRYTSFGIFFGDQFLKHEEFVRAWGTLDDDEINGLLIIHSNRWGVK